MDSQLYTQNVFQLFEDSQCLDHVESLIDPHRGNSTYTQLNASIDRFCKKLLSHGVEGMGLVAIFVPNGVTRIVVIRTSFKDAEVCVLS